MEKRNPSSFGSRGKKPSMNSILTKDIDYKNVSLLKRFTTERGKILPRRITGVTAKQQRYLTKAIKRARCIALMPFLSNEQ